MAEITQKSCMAFVLQKSFFFFCFFGGRGRADVNQQKHTKNSKFKFDKKSC